MYAIPNQEITTVADVMIKDIIGHFRERIELHPDQRCNFQSEFFRKLCERGNIRNTSTAAFLLSQLEWWSD